MLFGLVDHGGMEKDLLNLWNSKLDACIHGTSLSV